MNVIAELGSSPVTYEWNFDIFCNAAMNAGADSVKIQLWKADVIYRAHMREAKRAWEFPRARLREFVECAHAYGLRAGASVFDDEAVDMASRECDFLKLAASQQSNYSLIHSVLMAATVKNKPGIRSLSFLGGRGYPKAWRNISITTLYAEQAYPAGVLVSLLGLYRFFFYAQNNMMLWGHSSHTTGILDCILAARLGASVIEKHFALAPTDVEAPHSLLPDKFTEMVRRVK